MYSAEEKCEWNVRRYYFSPIPIIYTKAVWDRFLWVDLQIKMLCTMSMESDVIERLGSLPAGLEEAYKDIFIRGIDRESGRGKRLAYLAMMWMLCSAGPLSPTELVMGSVSALRVESAGSCATIGNDVNIETILKLCHNLVVIDHQLEVMRFAHLSVQEYLETLWKEQETNSMAAAVCLSILLESIPRNLSNSAASSEPNSPLARPKRHDESEDDEDWSSSADWSTQYSADYPYHGYFIYAFRQWHAHVRLCGDSVTAPRVVELLKRFLGSFETPSNAFINWLETYESLGRWYFTESLDHHNNFICSKPSVMPTVCYYGFGEIILDMWTSDQSFDFSMQNRFGHPLLSIASGQGNEWIIRELIRRGAEVDQPCKHYEVALNYAAEKGHEGAFQLLLDNGADVNRLGSDDESALSIAACHGRDRIVQMILDNGGEQHFKHALEIASGYGQLAVLQVLLENDANRSPNGSTIFHSLLVTAECRKVDCLKFLLSIIKESNIDNRKLSVLASNTLAAAVRGGCRDIIRLICQEFAGADLDLPSKWWGKTALHIALEEGFRDIVRSLLLQGARFRNVGRIELEDLEWAYDETWYAELIECISNIPVPLSYTPGEIVRVRTLFRKLFAFPVEVVDRILDLGEYWVRTECGREETACIEEVDDQDVPYISIPIKSHLRFPVRKAVFTIRSHDQGKHPSANPL